MKIVKKFLDRVIYNSHFKSIPPHNWKATWHNYSNVSYADIVKGTIHQAYGRNSVNCPLKVNCQLKASKVQNIKNKVSHLGTHVANTIFNTDKSVTCAEKSSVHCKNVGKPRENVNKLSTDCLVKGKKFNIGGSSVSKVNYGLNPTPSKPDPKVVSLCENDGKIQRNSVFENVNRFACLHQVSDDNTWSVLDDSSTVSKNNIQKDDETCTHEVVPQSSNTRVLISNCNVTNVKVINNCNKLTNNSCRGEALVSVQSASSSSTVDNPGSNEAVQTVDNGNFLNSKVSSKINQSRKNSVDSNSDKYDDDLRFRPRHREAVAMAKNCKIGIIKQPINMALSPSLK